MLAHTTLALYFLLTHIYVTNICERAGQQSYNGNIQVAISDQRFFNIQTVISHHLPRLRDR